MGGKGGGKREGGAERGHVSEWGKLPCTMWSDLYTEKDLKLTANRDSTSTHRNKKLISSKKNLHLVNYTTSGPYGKASQQDRWTECHNKMPSSGSQLPGGLWTDKRRLMKCQIRYYANTNS